MTTATPRTLRGFTLWPDGSVFGPSGAQLSPFPVKGYLRVTRYADGKFVAEPVHRLMCEAYHGPAPESRPHARHLDGNTAHNGYENLEWSDRPTNEADKIAHGTALLGERHHQARLTEDDVRVIRSLNMTAAQAALVFGVTARHINRIRRRKNWAHL